MPRLALRFVDDGEHRLCRAASARASAATVAPAGRRSACGGGGAVRDDRTGLLRAGRKDQVARILRRIGQRRQLGAGRARRGFDRADGDRQRPARQGRTERHEMAAREVAEHFGLAPVHAEQIGGARHVDVEEGAAHQEVGGFGRDVLGELGEPLRGDDAGEAALAAAAHQVGHGAERQLARFVGDFAGDGRREKLRLVDDHQHRIPMVALGIEHAAEKGRGGAHLLLDVEPFEIEHDGDAVLAHAAGDARSVRLRCARRRRPRWPNLSASVTKSPSGSMTHCCTQGALCSSRRRSRCDLPEPELPCTSRRVASNSSRSSLASAPPAAAPMSMPTFNAATSLRPLITHPDGRAGTETGSRVPPRVSLMASKAPMVRRRAVSMTDRTSA